MALRLTRLYHRPMPLTSLIEYSSISINSLRGLCTGSAIEATDPLKPKKEISKAMKSYLERAHEHESFMKVQNEEFQIGKRHLANMMGENIETFTQEDVDNAIAYLFPSGLYEKKARPFMKPPEEVFPARKAAEFNESGKPHHFLFYTGKPNFYKLLYEIVENINEANKFEDSMIRKKNQPDPALKFDMTGNNWVDCDSLSKRMVERVTDKEYENFVSAIERLSKHPYSYKFKDFIMAQTKPLMAQTSAYDLPEMMRDENGRNYVTTYECVRKTARGHVTIYSPGTGKVSINGQDITYFESLQGREQVLFPLLFTNMYDKVDVEGHVENGGTSGQAGAIRWGIAWGLRSFVDKEMIEKMRLAGLLTKDVRTRERKKPGQAGARRKFTWKKR